MLACHLALFLLHPLAPEPGDRPARPPLTVRLLASPAPTADREEGLSLPAPILAGGETPTFRVPPPVIVIRGEPAGRREPPVIALRKAPAPAEAAPHGPPAVAKAATTALGQSDPLAALKAAISRAVQAAVVYPPSARRSRRDGRTRLRFTFSNGRVGDIAVASSSGFPPFDNAAIQAVRRAVMPPVPAGLATRELGMLVWVRFRLVQDD